jgi:hypothetical protein
MEDKKEQALKINKIIDDWIYDMCDSDAEYENMLSTLPLVVDSIMKQIDESQKKYEFKYEHTVPFVQCNQCGRPFGTWTGTHGEFTDEKLYEPGTKIFVK